MRIPDIDFQAFRKIPRLSKDVIVTEKIDGTNGLVYVADDGEVHAGSRTRWIDPNNDNMGFAKWVAANVDELRQLGPGFHYGEWWGHGIQRNYALPEKRFSLFNVSRWADDAVRPACCHVVPVLYQGEFTQSAWANPLRQLRQDGSAAAPGFMQPEGVCIFHTASMTYFKKMLENDDKPKGNSK